MFVSELSHEETRQTNLFRLTGSSSAGPGASHKSVKCVSDGAERYRKWVRNSFSSATSGVSKVGYLSIAIIYR